MKKKVVTTIFAFAMLISCVFTFTACKKNNNQTKVAKISVALTNNTYTMTNNEISVIYGKKLDLYSSDFKVTATLNNGNTSVLSLKTAKSDGYTFSSTIPNDDITPAGTYKLTFSHSDLSSGVVITIKVLKSDINVSDIVWNYTSPLTYNGETQTVSLTNLPNGVSATYEGVQSAKDVGTYDVVAKLTYEDQNNYNPISDISLSWEISKANLTITANNNEITYGDTASNNGVSYNGFVNGENQAVLSGVLTYTYGEYTAGSRATTYPISVTGLSSENYNISYVNGTLTVNKKDLTITANNNEITYGDTASNNGVSYNGFVNGEDQAVLSGVLTYSYGEYTASSRATTYPISVTGLSSENYSISYVNGTLTVNKKDLTITANNNEITYGDTASNNGVSYNGFVNGEDQAVLSGTLTYTYGEYTAGSRATTYPISVTGLSSENYSISYVNGTLTVNKANLTITANNNEITYGDSASNNGVSFVGLVGNDTAEDLSKNITYIYGTYNDNSLVPYTPTKSVGTYYIYPELETENYNVTSNHGTLTVIRRTLTAKARNKTITYGNDAPSQNNYVAEFVGFVNGDTESVLTGSISFTCSYEKGNDAGSYNITPVSEGFTATNYVIICENGTLTVNKKDLTITAEDKRIAYGDAKPEFTATYSGFIDGDDESSLSGTLTFRCRYSEGTIPGLFKITPKGKTAKNYNITYEEGYLNVTKANLTATVSDVSITEGDDIPEFSVTYSGFKLSDNESVLSGKLTFTCSYEKGNSAGTYDITCSGLYSDKYYITFVKGTLSVS